MIEVKLSQQNRQFHTHTISTPRHRQLCYVCHTIYEPSKMAVATKVTAAPARRSRNSCA